MSQQVFSNLFNLQSFNLMGLENYLTKNGSFKDFNPCHDLDGIYCSAIVHLDSKVIAIRVVLRRYPSSSKGYRYLLLLISNTDVQVVADRVRDFFQEIGYKEMWKMFSG